MNLNPVVEGLEEKAKQSIKVNDGDYIGDNGLWYCGKCKTPKQVEVEFLGQIRKPMCLCRCEAEKREAEEKARKEAEERERLQRRIAENREAGFPESDMLTWTFENDDKQNVKVTNAMLRYVENFDDMKSKGKGLLLYGAVGTGKTFAACEVANALIDKGYSALVTSFSRLTNTIQGMYEGKQEYIDGLNNFDLLVIDDLGAERKSEYMQEMVYNIIDSRYRSGLPMIITTNLTIEEITKPDSIGNSRIYDRIIERCFPILVDGNSRRRKAVRADYEEIKKMLGL